MQRTPQHSSPTWTGPGVLLAVLGVGFGVAAIAATAAWQAGWLPGSGGSRATQAPASGARSAPAASSPGARAEVPEAHPVQGSPGAKPEVTLRQVIAGSHRWSVSRAQNGHTAPSPVSCTTDAGKFTCSGYCGTNAGKMLISADDSKLTLVFVIFCKRPTHKVLDYDVESFNHTRFRLQGPTDWQEWVLDD